MCAQYNFMFANQKKFLFNNLRWNHFIYILFPIIKFPELNSFDKSNRYFCVIPNPHWNRNKNFLRILDQGVRFARDEIEHQKDYLFELPR